MASDIVNFIFLSEILSLPVVNFHDSKKIGRILDLAATTNQVFPKITGIVIKPGNSKKVMHIPWGKVKKMIPGGSVTVEYIQESMNGASTSADTEILLRKTFLDKQIISTSGNKVVRVNDLHFLIDDTLKENSNLWLVHIDIGVKALLRRLGWGRFINAIFKWVMDRDIRDKFIPWKYVQPTATANVYGSLHLKIDSSKLSEVHPADMADILEDLGIDERISLIESLSFGTAAATLQEMPLKLRVQISETLEAGRLTNIINEMPMDEAVDLLDEISREHRQAVYALLPSEKVSELKKLSQLSIFSVGSIMNTDFITVTETQTVQEIIELLKAESKKVELIYYIYVVEKNDRLKGVVTIRNLLSSQPTAVIADIMNENVISVKIDTNIKRVAQIFFKYNFIAIPVVDDDDRIQGIITSRDAFESVFPEMKQESET